MAPLAVDPEAMYAAGSAVVAAGDGLAASLMVLTAGFAAHTGLDSAGTVFGLAYQDAAEQLLKAAAAAINACRQCGARIQQGAANYSTVEAASTLGGGSGALQAPPEPPKITPPGPPGTWGKGEPPPLLWAVVESFVDDVWPDGDVAALHSAAARWRNFGATASGMRPALNASKSLFDGQHIPEGDKIDEALSKIGDCLVQIGDQSGKLATNLDNFANQVEQAHHHIRDLLNRLGSLSDLGHDLMLIIKGDALEEIKKIAQDINGVLHDLGREARAAEQMVKGGMQVIDGLVVKLEKYTRGELKDFLGDAVGNSVATVFDTWLNANEGVLKGAVGMAVSMGDLLPVWSAVDPEGYAATWTGLPKNVWKGSLFNALLNPKEAGDTQLQQIKSLLHLEDWRWDRPGLGAGENLFDLSTLFIPGAGEAGAAVDGAGAAARGAEAAEAATAAARSSGRAAEGLGGLVSARGALADITKTGGEVTKNLEGVTKDLPKFEAPASGSPVALPGKPIEPPAESAPRPGDGAPGAPQGSTPATTSPGSAGPAGDSPGPPGGPSGGPRGPDSSSPPATSPGGSGGLHDPGAEPAPPAAPAAPGGPHDPVSMPSGGPHEPASVPAEAPREPVSVPAGGTHDLVAEPPGGPREPASVPAAGSRLASVQAAGDRLPSATPQLLDHSPAQVPVSPGGSSGEAATVSAHSPTPSPSSPPHLEAPGSGATELPMPNGGGVHGSGEGLPQEGQPHANLPHDVKPDGADDGKLGDGDGLHDQEGDHGSSGIPDKPIAGRDYPFSPDQVLQTLSDPHAEVARLAKGNVPEHILADYDPLAGRTPEEFANEFTVRDSAGNMKWDWDNQAPHNGFAGTPTQTDRIPAGLQLDRVGPNGGGFMSIEGETLPRRATPPGLASQYHTMAGSGDPVPDNWVVEYGPAKPAFGQPGGAEQWVVIDRLTGYPVPVEELDLAGVITDLTK